MPDKKKTPANTRTFELDNLNIQNMHLVAHKPDQRPPFHLEDESASIGADGFNDQNRRDLVDRLIARVRKL